MINLILILLLICTNANASQVTIPNVFSTNDTVTNVKLNGNNNALANVINGGLDNTNANTTNGYRFFQTVSTLPSAGSQGAVYYLTTDDSLNFDTGAEFNKSVSVNSPSNGDILYYNSGWNKLTIGSNNTILSSNGSIPSWGLTVGTGANNIVQLNASSKLPAVDGSQLTNVGTNITGALGSWSSKSIGTPYQATTDGFLTATATSNVSGNLLCKTDSSNPPTTTRSGSGSTTAATVGCSTPVKKNEYYEVDTGGTVTSVSIYFIPLGS